MVDWQRIVFLALPVWAGGIAVVISTAVHFITMLKERDAPLLWPASLYALFASVCYTIAQFWPQIGPGRWFIAGGFGIGIWIVGTLLARWMSYHHEVASEGIAVRMTVLCAITFAFGLLMEAVT